LPKLSAIRRCSFVRDIDLLFVIDSLFFGTFVVAFSWRRPFGSHVRGAVWRNEHSFAGCREDCKGRRRVEATVHEFELSSVLFGANCSTMKLPKSLSAYSLLPFILCVNLFPTNCTVPDFPSKFCITLIRERFP
jgi:hypothetical protein